MELVDWASSLDPGSLAEWAGVIATLAIALVSGIWAILRWRSSRDLTTTHKTNPTSSTPSGSQSDTPRSSDPTPTPSEAITTKVAHRERRIEVTWTSKNSFTLRNNQLVPLHVEAVRNRAEFVHLDLPDAFTLEAGRALQGHAFGAWQLPLPADLVLNIVGEDAPLVIPIPLRPGI